MTTRTEAVTIDDLRADLVQAQCALATLQQELASLPERLKEAARVAARSGDPEPVKDLQARQVILPEEIALLRERAEGLTRAVEDAEIAAAREQCDLYYPAVLEAQEALREAERGHQEAVGAWSGAQAIYQALSENAARRRAGIG